MGPGDTQIDFLIREYRLTRREIEVIDLIVTGFSNKQAAHALGISPRTVEVHRARAFEKCSVRNVASLALRIGALTVQLPLAFPSAASFVPQQRPPDGLFEHNRSKPPLEHCKRRRGPHDV